MSSDEGPQPPPPSDNDADPARLFDAPFYLAQFDDPQEAGPDPLDHYLQRGWRDGKAPHPLFDPAFYFEQRPDVREAGLEPLQHYMRHGWQEGSRPHPLFDCDFYLAHRPDAHEAAAEPLQHYLATGWREGAQPHPLFDPGFYFMQRPDAREAGLEPLAHYLTAGWRAGARPHPLFDPAVYMSSRPDGREFGKEPLQHYLRHGWREGARPHTLFDPAYYLEHHGELRTTHAEPLTHYLRTGWRAGARPHPLFDTEYVLAQRSDLHENGIEPLQHYLAQGWREELKPHPLFDPAFYLTIRPDVRDAGLEPLQHYLNSGAREGSRPHPLFNPSYYLAQRPDLPHADTEPLTHYLRHGSEGGADPHHLFFTAFYRDQAGHTGGLPPLLHYLTEGWRRGLSPHPLFDPDHYARQAPDGLDPDQPPLLHYAASGWDARLNPHPLFDAGLYLEQAPARHSFPTPLEHYLVEGWQAGLRPHALFDPAFYVAAHPDAAHENPLNHFVRIGRESGARTTATPIPAVVECLLRDGDLTAAVSAHAAFAPAPMNAQPRTVLLSLVGLKDYAQQHGCPLHEFPPEWIDMPAPRMVGDDRTDLQGGRLPCPPAFVTELRDVVLVAGTRVVVTTDGALLHDEIFLNRADPTLLVKPVGTVKRVAGEKAIVQLQRRPVDRVAAGIVLSSDYDQNYFHWLVEVLPKLTMIDALPDFDGVPVLVRSDLHPNLLRALDLVNVKRRPVVHLEPNAAYRVGRLVYPSDICRTVERDGGTIRPDSDCLLSPRWLQACVSTMLASLGQKPGQRRPLFLTRRAGIRRILNMDEIDLWFATRGYYVETFNDVGLEYQILRSRQATHLVAVTGAAVTNMMFCRPGTAVTIMMSSHRGQNPYVWQQLASCFGHDLQLLVGKRVYGRFDHVIHDDYRIELEQLGRAMQADAGR